MNTAVQSSPGKSSFLIHQEPCRSKGLRSLVGLIAESPVDGQVQHTFPAIPGKFAPLQQCLNAPSTWFCSHSHKTDRPHQLRQNPQRDENSPSPTQCWMDARTKCQHQQPFRKLLEEAFIPQGLILCLNETLHKYNATQMNKMQSLALCTLCFSGLIFN